MEKKQKTKVKKLQKKQNQKMKNKKNMIQKIIIKELNKRNRNKEKGEPSVNDLLKIILAQMMKEKQKPSYSDYFAHKQPAFGVEYHDEQKNKEEIGKNKEDISKIKDIIMTQLFILLIF